MAESAYQILSEGVKYMATGLLGLLWWDIRKVRQMKDTIMGEIKRDYLTENMHEALCGKQRAEIKTEFLEALHTMKDEIISEIKKANGG
jgi:hypothetical protein